jgi:predicted AlkP superfamily pyrophosphatase or phosphodiesterase
MNELPGWVKKFNERDLAKKYMSQPWNTLYPISTYKQSTADDKPYESNLTGEDNSFPHRLDTIRERSRFEAFRFTPFGNSFTCDMARAAIEGEQLGQRGVTDFLAVSFSSPDYIGHSFGPNSIEAEDTYLRLDRDLAAFLSFLDREIGAGQYLVFLSADHGAAHVPGFLKENKIPAGAMDDAEIKKWINENAAKKFGVAGVVEQIINYQVYLNHSIVEEKKVDATSLKDWIINQLVNHPAILSAYDLKRLSNETLPSTIRDMVSLGYNQKLSGDIQFLYKPHWFDGWDKGTTHGAWNPYDSHIPLLWYGWKIKPGKTTREIHMSDIAPTLAALLKIQMPSGSVGKVIGEVVKD